MTKYYTLRVQDSEIDGIWKKTSIFKRILKKPSPYVKVTVGDVIQRSSIAEKTLVPTWNDEFPIFTPMNGFMINIEIIHMLVLAKGEILYKPDEESKNKEVQLRVDLRSPKDKRLKSSGFITLSISSSDANGVAELAIRKLLQVVLSDNKTASTFDELIQNGMAGYRSDLAGTFKESIPFVDTFINNMDELADSHPYLKLAWGVTTMVYKAIQSQIEFDKQVKDMIEELVRTFRIIRDTVQIRRPLESFTATTNELLDLVIRLSIFIREYARHDFMGRALYINDKAAINEFEARIKMLKDNLKSSFTRQGVVAASRAADSGLLRRLEHYLKPVYISGDDRPECMDDTHASRLKEIEEWIQDKNQPNLLFLVGDVGSGKSTIATTIAERYRLKKQLGCFMFFSRGKSDPDSVIRTMAHKLASLNQTIAENLDDALRNYGEITSATLGSQFKILLHEPLQSSAKNESNDPVLVVLDGLDECGTPQSRSILLQIFKKEIPTLPSKYRFLLTGRPEADILPFLSLPFARRISLEQNLGDSKA
ncbi:WD40 domain containing protein [Pyrrhoderma noxium]|uniref:WD40 domain containing protein n=1 Tax=Pyrrhoderma noxium TaxID=2282107 RepID=A0A286UD83_9AGAM|nr:WD40 domain containing protein [Pyrrhoderma noxium]